MPEIIVRGQNAEWKFRLTCGCGTVAAFERHEVVCDSRDGDYLTCPVCRANVSIRSARVVLIAPGTSDRDKECTTVRDAARRRQPLDGADAQALEGALAATERERDNARSELRRMLVALRDRMGIMADGESVHMHVLHAWIDDAKEALAAGKRQRAVPLPVLSTCYDCRWKRTLGVYDICGHPTVERVDRTDGSPQRPAISLNEPPPEWCPLRGNR